MLILPSCIQVHHKVDPIHMVVDVNLRVERELEDFFAFEKSAKPSATQPTSQADRADNSPALARGGSQ